MKPIFTLLLAICMATASSAQLFFKNNTDKPVNVACALKSNARDFSGWFSRGWILVAPNERKMLNPQIGSNDYVYYYASRNGMEFSGNTPFLVDPVNGFSIKNANMEYAKGQNTNYEVRKFREVKMNSVLKLKYTIEFNY